MIHRQFKWSYFSFINGTFAGNLAKSQQDYWIISFSSWGSPSRLRIFWRCQRIPKPFQNISLFYKSFVRYPVDQGSKYTPASLFRILFILWNSKVLFEGEWCKPHVFPRNSTFSIPSRLLSPLLPHPHIFTSFSPPPSLPRAPLTPWHTQNLQEIDLCSLWCSFFWEPLISASLAPCQDEF